MSLQNIYPLLNLSVQNLGSARQISQNYNYLKKNLNNFQIKYLSLIENIKLLLKIWSLRNIPQYGNNVSSRFVYAHGLFANIFGTADKTGLRDELSALFANKHNQIKLSIVNRNTTVRNRIDQKLFNDLKRIFNKRLQDQDLLKKINQYTRKTNKLLR